MFLREISIENIRSISKLKWELGDAPATGWHVVIGDNGSGKTTFLRSVGLALVGRKRAMALLQDWDGWVGPKVEPGRVRLAIARDSGWDVSEPKIVSVQNFIARFRIDHPFDDVEQVRHGRPTYNLAEPYLSRVGKGWFSASFGPFRRFSGGDRDAERVFESNPRLAPHLSLFGENVALTESLSWLKDLRLKEFEKHPEGHLLESIKKFVNQKGFLPHHTQLTEVSSEGVKFVDGNGSPIRVEDLSDGYRSILSLTFELIRQLARNYGPDRIFDVEAKTVIPPGVVLIDEVDAHLHPSWQRQIGFWLREHFPNIQFIVTTHSPLVCQAATVGSVFRLPRPGTDEVGAMVTGVELDRLLYGNVLDAYSTELFGDNISRSDEAKEKLQRLAELNVKELRARLTAGEKEEQNKLRAAMPTAAHFPENVESFL